MHTKSGTGDTGTRTCRVSRLLRQETAAPEQEAAWFPEKEQTSEQAFWDEDGCREAIGPSYVHRYNVISVYCPRMVKAEVFVLLEIRNRCPRDTLRIQRTDERLGVSPTGSWCWASVLLELC